MIEVKAEDFLSIVVGVDPALTSGEDADETGIIVAASGPHQPETCSIQHCYKHAYILEDATLPKGSKVTPEKWGRRVIDAYDEWNAGRVVVEGNAGRELLRAVLQNIRPTIPVDLPHAGKSKTARAEPVVTLYEQGRVHHLGPPSQYAQLEDQMTTWVPTTARGKSPDRMDALVWAVSALEINDMPKARWTLDEGMSPLGFGQANGWRI